MKLSELLLNRFLYKNSLQDLETKDSVYDSSNNISADIPAVPSGSAAIDINNNTIQVFGTQIVPGTIPTSTLNLADVGWTQTSVFSVTDSDTVSWTAGTFTSANGTVLSISAGNTGNMTSKTYIYLDVFTSNTAYQTTTNIVTPVGNGKVLIAVAEKAIAPSTTATYNLSQTNSIVGDNILANTIVAGKMNVGQLSAISADLGTITAGTIIGALIKTSNSTNRVEIKNDNSIVFYDANGYARTTIKDGLIGFRDPYNNISGGIYSTNNGEVTVTSAGIYRFDGSAFFPGYSGQDIGKNAERFQHAYFSGDVIVGSDVYVETGGIQLGGVYRTTWPSYTPSGASGTFVTGYDDVTGTVWWISVTNGLVQSVFST